MEKEWFIAHKDENNRIQTVKQHSEGTAKLCEEFCVPSLKPFAYNIGLLHDIGKYTKSFQEHINGKPTKVEHSICGAQELEKLASGKENYLYRLIAQFCIAGHHTGLPDGGRRIDSADESTLNGRLNRTVEDFSAYKEELEIKKFSAIDLIQFMATDVNNNKDLLYDKMAFIIRYLFSCLVDADSLDTASFMNQTENNLEILKADFGKALDKVNEKLNSFVCETELQKARGRIQQQVFDKVNLNSEIYLINMPTGSGKTLCSVKYALERVINTNKKRIIYIIPYNSIIDQTYDQFESLFGQDVSIVRHQSTFVYDEDSEDELVYKKKLAIENWDAPFIITTAAQFFDSLYDNKRSKLRKMHNMADSVLVFDETHLIPLELLQPCLQAISFLTKYLNSEALFLTATMPDFNSIIKRYALENSKVEELISDKFEFSNFNKCKFELLGNLSITELLDRANDYRVSLLIVNTREHARKLYDSCVGKKYHLSTYMTPFDRKRVLADIKYDIANGNEKITIISTSLIEAGVDLDADVVFRELAGLDSILQAGGRCNREGKKSNAYTYVFELSEGKKVDNPRTNITKGVFKKFEDVSCSESIKYYYDELIKYCESSDAITKYTIHNMLQAKTPDNIPFKKYAEQFNFIESKTISIFVVRDDKSREMLDVLKYSENFSERKLQMYVCSIYQNQLNDLIKQHVIENYNGIWVLTNCDYYDENVGITFESKDYFI